ncbi:MAG: rubrerythrin family protein [Gammaproteobacteria bacterium]|nr:rubrerythrin family protein [Gammaproteobacteria bacterium]
MGEALLEIAQGFYRDEVNDHATYKRLAEHTKDPRLRGEILRVARMERGHASFWRSVVESRGKAISEPGINRMRLAFLRLLQTVTGPGVLVSTLELGEAGAFKRYHHFLKRAPLDEQEKSRLQRIILDELEHERLFRRESATLGSVRVRDFVLGMNDGLVEILGAVTGLSAVYAGRPIIVGVSGLVVGIAGAASMGIGAFVSVRSQRQIERAEKARMEVLYDVAPERLAEEYKDKLVQSGVPLELADELSHRDGQGRETMSRLLVGETRADEIPAALFTGIAYLIGILFPVLPYFILPTSLLALGFSVLFAGIALAVVATAIAVFSGISVREKCMEMITLAFAAAVLAYGFGKLVQIAYGVSV